MTAEKGIRTYNGAAAIVTGAASGIGRALAGELARRTCEVVLADLQIELAEEAAAKINASGGKATAAVVDVTDPKDVRRVVSETVERTGRLDYIFNNAGIAIGGPVALFTDDDWRRIVEVNLGGVINGVQAAYPVMLQQGFGHIVNTASVAGLMASPGNTPYATTKHAVVGLSTSLRTEAAHMGVRVSVICPGAIRTPIWHGGRYGKMLVEFPAEKLDRMVEALNPISPEVLARYALDGVAENQAIVVAPASWKRIWWIHRLSSSLGLFLARRYYENMLKHLA
jgi:NAD(P)-dependent dehydrogenase (short-subunit alcohol dehydrogenase family)